MRLAASPSILCPLARSPPLLYTLRTLHISSIRPNSKPIPIKGASDISHSHFISSASPTSDFNPTQSPHAGSRSTLSSSGDKQWEGKLCPTNSHLFKLILPLPLRREGETRLQPTAFLLHPSQPLSHLSRLIAGSLPPEERDVEIDYLALTGQEQDLDSHLRNAEEQDQDSEVEVEADTDGARAAERQEGGPHLTERSEEAGHWQEVSWSQSTDLSDFIKQSCINERFTIVIKRGGSHGDATINVVIPSFASRTTYLRKRLLSLTKELDRMTKQKKAIDIQAHAGARRLIVAGLTIGVAYWGAVIRWTFFTDAGWDVMEPVTWSVGFGTVLLSAAFLAYHNREVSYSSILDLSITARQRSLYEKHGLDIDRWTEMVAEAKTIRKEMIRIAADYDIEWKGELENLEEKAHRPRATRSAATAGSNSSLMAKNGQRSTSGDTEVETEEEGEEEKIDIDKTIDEADELASSSSEQRDKEKAAQRKGEVVEEKSERGDGGAERKSSAQRGREKAEELAKKGR